MTATGAPQSTSPDAGQGGSPLFAGGGEVGSLMRGLDWAASRLGPPESWPAALRTVVDLMLRSRFPMFVAWGDELTFLYNDPYARILGSKHPRALGRPFHDIWAEIWSDISPLIDAAMAGQASYREDLPLVMNRAGYDEETWFTFSYSPVRDDTGRVAGMFCACTETTGRVLAERRLRELNETLERRVEATLAERGLLAELVERTSAFVQVADLEYRWLALNRAAADEFERIFGVRPVVGRSMLDMLADQPEQQAAVRDVWSRALAGEEFVEVAEFGAPGRDRRCYEMRYSTLRDRHGARIGAYQFVYDVTDKVRDQQRLRLAEEALRQSQKLESLGQLTGGVAHDFNNLLAVFANGLQLLKFDVDGAKREQVFASMQRAIQRGSGLTHQLLAFSRRRAINPMVIDLSSHLLEMRDLLTRSLRGDIEVRMNLSPDLRPVEVDPGELELALLNLCINARDAMPGGGVIEIAARNERDADMDCVLLSVEDHGMGMTQEVLARALEPFFTTKEVGKGSGLGLPQVYGFVQQSGGRLTLDSEVGQGTIVTLMLPASRRVPAPLSAREASHRLPPPRSSGHALLVEDDPEVASLTVQMLGHLGFTVTHVSGAHAALGVLASGRKVDVVLSDIMMPGGMDGVALAREIRRRRPELRVILTTGLPESASGLAAAEFTLLLKPYGLESLAQALGVATATTVTSASSPDARSRLDR